MIASTCLKQSDIHFEQQRRLVPNIYPHVRPVPRSLYNVEVSRYMLTAMLTMGISVVQVDQKLEP